MKITQTKNYSLFVSDQMNRPVTEKHRASLKALTASMKQYGFLPFPLLVKRTGSKLVIIDGQHRFQVAEELSLPVLYVETDRDDIQISTCARGQSPWKVEDYAGSFAAQGVEAYQELLEFAKKHSLPIARATAILSGNGAMGSNSVTKDLKAGEFVIKDRAHANRVAEIVGELSRLVSWARTGNSINAISKFVRVPQFDAALLIKKAQAHSHLLQKQPTSERYSEMYEEVYNHSSRSKIPLAFYAREAAAARLFHKDKSKKAA